MDKNKTYILYKEHYIEAPRVTGDEKLDSLLLELSYLKRMMSDFKECFSFLDTEYAYVVPLRFEHLWYNYFEQPTPYYDDLVCLLPEFFLITIVLCLLTVGVFFHNFYISIGKSLGYQLGLLSIGSLICLFFLVLDSPTSVEALEGSIVKSQLTLFLSLLVLFGCISVVFLWLSYVVNHESLNFEGLIIFFLVVLGSYMILTSNDFLSLYIGVELQSLCLYILACLKTNSTYSTEAGVKYFILGGLASSFLLFGITLVYGFTGVINYSDLKLIVLNLTAFNLDLGGLSLGFFFIFCGLIFKVGGAPFHLWVPDVYEGAPMIVTGFFAIVPKLAIFGVLLRLLSDIVYHFDTNFLNLFLFSGILSILIGSFGAVMQISIKRLLSYSAISHGGFILYALSMGVVESIACACFYLVLYVVLLVNIFAVLISLVQVHNNSSIKLISNLRYLQKSNALLNIFAFYSFFGIAGIPPLSGFFSKLFVFFTAISNGAFLSGSLCIFLSVVGSVYYLKVARSMMFVQNSSQWIFFKPISRLNAMIITYTGLFNILFIVIGYNFIYDAYNVGLGQSVPLNF